MSLARDAGRDKDKVALTLERCQVSTGFVSTAGGVVDARSVEVLASVSTGDIAVGARSAEVPASVSTGGSAASALSV